ncbi:hypothetical protein DC081_09710 [Ignatzschineria cameli]|uniref:Uncharacterized protein n=1 Tax=Ignatzschineria cameli TaxID=2182793 RepID=A0A2U2AKP0_9GAMM|nr:hypothetical protein DC077_09740 [Ignatzschineria cameli]PWD88470.1 hypothetical protein DC079_09455 [Ignatzschineria cameli]PWD89076.1 hypothetical protein DC081_09710 [Ignatzschineria cameli]PWD89735.1 hypothetical protein DC078_09485 [Ignatzschineria cameli]
MPDITIALFHRSCAGMWQSLLPATIIFNRSCLMGFLSALKVPFCGHAVDIRARWFPPAFQQILLWAEAIK